MAERGWRGAADAPNFANEYSATDFQISQVLALVQTMTLVKVTAVTNAGGISPVGFVDVQLLVNQLDGKGNAVPHGIVHGLPYFRLQGGGNAVILDPVVGDLGFAVFASRDISKVKSTKRQANPGSFRRFDFADGVYIGGILNGVPTQYVVFSSTGVKIVSPTKISLQAPTIEVTGDVTATGEITAGFGGGDSVTLQQHQHGTGSPAAGTTPPSPGT